MQHLPTFASPHPIRPEIENNLSLGGEEKAVAILTIEVVAEHHLATLIAGRVLGGVVHLVLTGRALGEVRLIVIRLVLTGRALGGVFLLAVGILLAT